jgi:hypothetical protein
MYIYEVSGGRKQRHRHRHRHLHPLVLSSSSSFKYEFNRRSIKRDLLWYYRSGLSSGRKQCHRHHRLHLVFSSGTSIGIMMCSGDS